MNLKVVLLFYVEEQKEENQSQMGTFALGKRGETNGRLGNGPPFQNRLETVRFVLELGGLGWGYWGTTRTVFIFLCPLFIPQSSAQMVLGPVVT